MTKEELIAKQQLEIENLRETLEIYKKNIHRAKMQFIAISAPLNDNILMMNREQLNWCQSVLNIIDVIGVEEETD